VKKLGIAFDMKNGVKANSAQTDMWFKWFDNWKIGGSLPRLQ